MKPEDFEQRLARTPRTGPPPAWRAEILAAARSARAESAAVASAEEPRRGGLLRGRVEPISGAGWRQVGEWIRGRLAWASPWGVLAAGWAVVLAVNGAGAWLERPSPASLAIASRHHATPSSSPAAVLMAARNYRAEVVALAERDDAAAESAPVTMGLPATPPLPGAPDGRPRTEWDPGRRGAALTVGTGLA